MLGGVQNMLGGARMKLGGGAHPPPPPPENPPVVPKSIIFGAYAQIWT